MIWPSWSMFSAPSLHFPFVVTSPPPSALKGLWLAVSGDLFVPPASILFFFLEPTHCRHPWASYLKLQLTLTRATKMCLSLCPAPFSPEYITTPTVRHICVSILCTVRFLPPHVRSKGNPNSPKAVHNPRMAVLTQLKLDYRRMAGKSSATELLRNLWNEISVSKKSHSLNFLCLQIPYSHGSVVHAKVHASILALLISCSTLNSQAVSLHRLLSSPDTLFSLWFSWSCLLAAPRKPWQFGIDFSTHRVVSSSTVSLLCPPLHPRISPSQGQGVSIVTKLSSLLGPWYLGQ